MKFSLAMLFLETTLICIWLAAAFAPALYPMRSASFSEYAIELGLRSAVMLISGAAIGGLINRPVVGAMVGLALSGLLIPIMLLSATF